MSCQRILWGLALAVGGAQPSLAQDEDFDALKIDANAADESSLFTGEPSRCLPLSRVRRTEIIDDSTIVFYTRRKEAYVNNLPRSCPGLEVNGRFMYEVHQSRLCETDWITVLERFGVGYGRGFTCRLGVFHPANEEIVAILKNAAETGLGTPTSTATPVELPDPDAATTPAPAETSDDTPPAPAED